MQSGTCIRMICCKTYLEETWLHSREVTQKLLGGEFAVNPLWVGPREPVQAKPTRLVLGPKERGDSIIFLGTDQISVLLILSDVGTTL